MPIHQIKRLEATIKRDTPGKTPKKGDTPNQQSRHHNAHTHTLQWVNTS